MTAEAKSTIPYITTFFCGGGATNIGSSYIEPKLTKGMGIINPVFCDTSNSNIRRLNGGANKLAIELLPDTDGSGGVRGENHEAIGDIAKSIILRNPPTSLNIVVFTASGGSGSVFGPYIAKELIAQGESVIVIVIGSEESLIRANNTIKTLKTLDYMASQILKKPITMFFAHNKPGDRYSVVDEQVHGALGALSVLASGQNDGLDTKDLANFFQFSPVSTALPQLALLEIVDATGGDLFHSTPVALASLYTERDAPRINLMADYDCHGYVPDVTLITKELHFVITCDDVIRIAREIETRVADITSKANARSQKTNIVRDTDQATSGGIIL